MMGDLNTTNREHAGVSVLPSDLSEVHVHFTTSDAHILPYCGGMRLYADIDSGETLDDLIEALTEARTLVNTEANRRWTEAVKEDADSELVGNPREEVAA